MSPLVVREQAIQRAGLVQFEREPDGRPQPSSIEFGRCERGHEGDRVQAIHDIVVDYGRDSVSLISRWVRREDQRVPPQIEGGERIADRAVGLFPVTQVVTEQVEISDAEF